MQDPEGLLRSALEKIVFFECRVSQLESELASAQTAVERARADASASRRREVELEQALAGEKGQRGDGDRRADEAEERVRLLEAERERLLAGLVDRARIAGAPDGSESSVDEEGQADLAGFIAELRAEIETLRAFKASAVAAGFGAAGARDPVPAATSDRGGRRASIAELGGRFDAAGRVGVSAGDAARMKELLATRADRALYERSMAELDAPEAGKRLRAVHALEALGSRAAAPLLAAALGREREPEVKAALLGALARVKGPFAADLAARELGDGRPAVRIAALEALAAAGDSRATERLAAALSDESPLVRRRAALLLGFAAGERADEALAIALSDQDRGVARAAAAALSGRPSARAQGALARGLEHPDLSVRRAAATSLGRVAGEAVDADGSASARRASCRRISEKLAAMDGDELRAAVLRSAATAKATAERVLAATAHVHGALRPSPTLTSVHPERSADGSAVHPERSADGSAAHPERSADGLAIHPERSADGLAVHPERSADGLAVHPERSTDGLAVHPERSADGLVVHPERSADAEASARSRRAASSAASALSSLRSRTAVAVLDAPQPGGDDLEARVVGEIRAALRGCSTEQLASVLGTPPDRVEAALAVLAVRGNVERRGTRWFMS
jgi:HEAT repeat protein